MLIAGAALVGLAAGRLLAPLRRRARVTLTWWPLLPAGALAQMAGQRLDGTAAFLVVLAGYCCLLAFATGNLHLTGAGVVAVGLGLNLVPIVFNGGMPVRASALADAGLVTPEEADSVELRGSRQIEDGGEILSNLGDIVPVPFASRVVSFGDLILVVGTADAIAHLSRRRAPGRARRAGPSRAGPSRAGPHSDQRATITAQTTAGSSRSSASSRARPLHDWGEAPKPRPSSGSQYSAKPEASAPDTVHGATPATADASR